MHIFTEFGYCDWEITKEFTHIYNLYVYHSNRRQGKARELLQLAINQIRNTGYTGPIDIVANPREGNIPVGKLKSFYVSMGLNVYECYK